MRTTLFLLTFFFWAKQSSAQNEDTSGIYIPDSILMNEVVISAKVKARVSADTFTYIVDSFKRNQDSYAEDVLKNLPGVSVSFDGKVSFQGYPIEYIYINGEEFHTSDLRNVTQNMPSDVLDKIQLFDWKSIEDNVSGARSTGKRKAINLIFKKQYNNAAFGNVNAGAGNKETYSISGLGNYYSDIVKVTAIGDIDHFSQGGSRAGSTGNRSLPDQGLNSGQNANINVSKSLSDNFKANIGYDFRNDDVSLEENILKKTFLPDGSSLLTSSENERTTHTEHHKFSIGSVYTAGKWIVKSNLSFTRQSVESTGKIVDANTNNIYPQNLFRQFKDFTDKTIVEDWSVASDVIKTFSKDRRVWSLKFKYFAGKNLSEKEMSFLRESIKTDSYCSKADNYYTSDNIQLALKMSEPIGRKGLLILACNYHYERNDAKISTYIDTASFIQTQEKTVPFSADRIQSGDLRNLNSITPVSIMYQYANGRMLFGGGLEAQLYHRNNYFSSNASQLNINYTPRLYATYNISKTSSVDARFQNNVNLPSIRQLSNVPDYTDSLNVYIGNPNLKTEINNVLLFSFNKTNIRANSALWFTLDLNWTTNKIVTSTYVDIDKRVTKPINTNGNYDIKFSAGYSFYFFLKRLKADVLLENNVFKNTVFTNGTLQQNKTLSITPGLKLEYRINDIFQTGFIYWYTHLGSKGYLFETSSQIHYLSSFGKANFINGLSLEYDVMHLNNNGSYHAKNPIIINLSVSQKFKKIQGLTVQATLNDMLNNDSYTLQNITGNQYEQRTVNRIGRYLMLSVRYRFNYFPTSKTK